MTTETPAAITNIEDASTARFVARALAPARDRVLAQPTEEAVERIRARIFGKGAAGGARKTRTLAA